MENTFTPSIKMVLQKHFGKTADNVFDKSQLIQLSRPANQLGI
jgi:hypothetical protein